MNIILNLHKQYLTDKAFIVLDLWEDKNSMVSILCCDFHNYEYGKLHVNSLYFNLYSVPATRFPHLMLQDISRSVAYESSISCHSLTSFIG